MCRYVEILGDGDKCCGLDGGECFDAETGCDVVNDIYDDDEDDGREDENWIC
jgi:hypothetical protein